jgi:GR25 family glycosyltransferase involved in LPS biosynthesis
LGPTQGLADGAVVINLDDRTDRWKAFQERVAPQLGIDTVERLSAVRGTELPGFGEPPFFHGRERDRTWAGRAGCTLSHRAALSRALKAGWQRVLILEDDIELAPGFSSLHEPLALKLARLDWDVCYLGFTDPIGPVSNLVEAEQGHSISRLYGCNTTHAYLVNARAYETLLKWLPSQATVWRWLTRNRAIDRWYSRTLSRKLHVIAVTPSVINQIEDVSDITGRKHERKHLTEITEPSRSGIDYFLRQRWRRTAFAIEGGYDALRGMVKRQRGF